MHPTYEALREVNDIVHGCMMYTERAETAAVLRGTSRVTAKQHCQYTTWVDIHNAPEKASHSFRIACDKSAVSLLESGEQHHIKAIIIISSSKVPGGIKRSRDLEEGGGAGPSS